MKAEHKLKLSFIIDYFLSLMPFCSFKLVNHSRTHDRVFRTFAF